MYNHSDDTTTVLSSYPKNTSVLRAKSESMTELFPSMTSTEATSNATPSPPSHRLNAAGITKKKRVRREVRELKYLREQERELELRLEQLQKRVTASRDGAASIGTDSDGAVPSVWKHIAERQLKARLDGEQRKKELLTMYSIQGKLVLELKKQLKLSVSDIKLSVLLRKKSAKVWDLLASDESGVYAEQLTQVAKMYLKMQQESPLHSLQLSPDITQGVEVLRRNPGSDAEFTLEMCFATTVPFDIRVAGNAFWRLSTYEMYRRQGAQLESRTEGDVVSTLFELQVQHVGFTANVRGSQTSRRYCNEDSEVIVSIAYADPIEFNGTKFFGMQCQKKGWIKLQRAAGEGGQSTRVEIYSEMTPLFKDEIEDQKYQVHALIDSTARAHSATNSVYCQMVHGLLLEEDWKATYGTT